jgi:hypothetical protein
MNAIDSRSLQPLLAGIAYTGLPPLPGPSAGSAARIWHRRRCPDPAQAFLIDFSRDASGSSCL